MGANSVIETDAWISLCNFWMTTRFVRKIGSSEKCDVSAIISFSRTELTPSTVCNAGRPADLRAQPKIFQRRTVELFSWAPTGMGKGGGHLPFPGKVEKCYRVIKLHLRSQFERPRRCFSVKKDREWLFNNDYFISVYCKRIVCCCTRILKEIEGTPRMHPPDLGLESQR